MVRM